MLKLVRGIHINCTNWSNKTQLLKLRKKTGYPFNSCKKALELNDNSLEKSELWLKEEAQRLGWAKANKLANRATIQGLIALSIDDRKEIATILEVNCETDFVARNKFFHSIVEEVTSSCFDFAKKQIASENSFSKVNLKTDELMALIGTEEKILADHVAITIGNLGENITLRRATCLNTKNTDLNIIGLTHPSNLIGSNCFIGKYGSIIIYRKQQKNEQIGLKSLQSPHDEILRQMCQHVIGMNPKSVGIPNTDAPNRPQEPIETLELNDSDDSSMDNIDEKTPDSEIEENRMLNQVFLLDSSFTVGQVANDYGIEVVDFERYECGEN